MTNVFVRDEIFDELNRTRREHRTACFACAITGFIFCALGAVLLAFERVHLQITTAETLSNLAYGYNALLLLGGALASTSAFHYYAKRNEEVKRLTEIDSELRRIRADRLDILGGGDRGQTSGSDPAPNGLPLPPERTIDTRTRTAN